MPKKFFDLHIECGLDDTGLAYAKTILGSNHVVFQEDGLTIAEAIQKLSVNLEANNVFSVLMDSPHMSTYPLGTDPVVPNAIDPKAPKKMPSELGAVVHPDCKIQCSSFEHFGENKCKSMCRQRRL